MGTLIWSHREQNGYAEAVLGQPMRYFRLCRGGDKRLSFFLLYFTVGKEYSLPKSFAWLAYRVNRQVINVKLSLRNLYNRVTISNPSRLPRAKDVNAKGAGVSD